MFRYESMVAISIPREVAIVAGLCPTLCMLFACATAESFTVSDCRVAGAVSAVGVCTGAVLTVGNGCTALDCVTLEIAMDAMWMPRFSGRVFRRNPPRRGGVSQEYRSLFREHRHRMPEHDY
jgi:hypothetical protein